MSKFITDLTVAGGVTLITLTDIPSDTNFIHEIFKHAAEFDINLDMICKNPPYSEMINLSFTLSDDDFPKALKLLTVLKNKLPKLKTQVASSNAKITVFGEGMRSAPGVAEKVFGAIAATNVPIILITTSECDISLLVDDKAALNLAEKLRQQFDL